ARCRPRRCGRRSATDVALTKLLSMIVTVTIIDRRMWLVKPARSPQRAGLPPRRHARTDLSVHANEDGGGIGAPLGTSASQHPSLVPQGTPSTVRARPETARLGRHFQ